MKLPVTSSLPYGGHDKIGQFQFEHLDGNIMVRWNLLDKPEKQATFEQLCFNPGFELDRLELGWMIANMARLDEVHQLEEAVNTPHPEYCMREMNSISNYFNKIEKRWRHWGIVSAGHMLA